jgi:hypothetical protein
MASGGNMFSDKAVDLPTAHKQFLEMALPRLREDPRLVGVAAAGSWLRNDLDDFSDLDLVVACESNAYPEVRSERMQIAESLGRLAVGFTGEHVGEPRLLICLYEDPLLHVDLKFLAMDDLDDRLENPQVLWEREGRLTEALGASKPNPAPLDLQWLEDRFWVWLHYGAQRLGRGEIFETLDLLAYLRKEVLGPMILAKHGLPPRGLRRLEQACREDLPKLSETLAGPAPSACEQSLRAAAKLYVELREMLDSGTVQRRRRAEMAVIQYLHRVSEHLSGLHLVP